MTQCTSSDLFFVHYVDIETRREQGEERNFPPVYLWIHPPSPSNRAFPVWHSEIPGSVSPVSGIFHGYDPIPAANRMRASNLTVVGGINLSLARLETCFQPIFSWSAALLHPRFNLPKTDSTRDATGESHCCPSARKFRDVTYSSLFGAVWNFRYIIAREPRIWVSGSDPGFWSLFKIKGAWFC